VSGSEAVGASESRANTRGAVAYAVAIVHYQGYDDLERCLASVAWQTLAARVVTVLDADPDPIRLARARESHPDVSWQPVANLGYAGGANRLLATIAAAHPDVDFVLLLNPDVILEPEFTQNLLRVMSADGRVAIATGKLLRPGGRVIDSAGIVLPRHRRPRDRGSEQIDRGQFDVTEPIFGASGAAMLLRRSALEDIAIEGEVFDESFFLYHEDTDLCWRANLLGWRVIYEPTARATHARGWQRERRFGVPVTVRRHSFKNHYLQLVKNESARGLLVNLPVLATWELLRLGFALLRDRAILPAYGDALRLLPGALRKRRILQRRVRERRARARSG